MTTNIARGSSVTDREVSRLAELYGFVRPLDVLAVRLEAKSLTFRVLSRDASGRQWIDPDTGRPAEHDVMHFRKHESTCKPRRAR